MKNLIVFFIALYPFFLFAQKQKTTDTPIPSTEKLQKIFQCPGLLREFVSLFYVHGDTFEVRLKNGSWGKSIKGQTTWVGYIMGLFTAIVDCDTSRGAVEGTFPVNFINIFTNCDSSVMLLEEYGAVYIAEVSMGTTYLIEICDVDIGTLTGFNIASVRRSTESEILEYKKITGIPKPGFTYTVISKNRIKGKNEKMMFSRAGPLVSLKENLD